MADPNPLSGMPLADALASQMSDSLQWMSRMWGNPAASQAGAESRTGGLSSLSLGLPSMLIPTLDPDELEKRINDLKAVEHWLDMNRVLLHSTIQTLEMQRNAILALRAMARSAQPGSSVPGQAAPGGVSGAPSQPDDDTAARAQSFAFDPAPWWNALQEQFARVAAAAAKEPEPAAADPQTPREADTAPPPGGWQWPQSPLERKSGREPPA
jgi:hypothetical protein